MKMDKSFWQTSRRRLFYGEKILVMGILNVTPDSFSDGGRFDNLPNALLHAERMIEEGADILDIGGESTRPSGSRVTESEEIERVVPVINEIAKRFDIPISVDTTKAGVARAAIEAGAEIINDVSGLRFDEKIGETAAETNAGLVLMHLRGDFETMHKQEPVEDILGEVRTGLHWSLKKARAFGVKQESISLDVGIGFSKTFEQNLELLAKLNRICVEFADFPILAGTSRKSFIGKILDGSPPEARLHGTMASAALSAFNGANIIRVHDVRAAVETLRVAGAIRAFRE